MKKSIILLSIIFIASATLFASSNPQLDVSLNLKNADVNLFGITTGTTAPDVSTYALASDLYDDEKGTLEIGTNKTDMMNTASFWVWWYVYTDEPLHMFISFDSLKKDTDSNPIPFSIIDGKSKNYESSGSFIQVQDISNERLDNGSLAFTIQPINKTAFDIGVYTSTITIKISAS